MRDIIYLDLPKASSLLSQAEGGLIQELREHDETSSDARGGLRASAGLLGGELGGSASERRGRSETRVPHHALLHRLEEVLVEQQLLVDLSSATVAQEVTSQSVHRAIGDAPCIRATGLVELQDYEAMSAKVTRVNPLAALVANSARFKAQETTEYRELREKLIEGRATAHAERNRERRTKMLAAVRALEKKVDQALDAVLQDSDLSPIPEWLVEGIGFWIDTFRKGHFIMRLWPLPELPDFEVQANLKRDQFFDTDIGHVMYTYGSRPTLPLTCLGLITSLPEIGGHPLDPIREAREAQPRGTDAAHAMDRAFSATFDGFQAFEQITRMDEYPNIKVYPLAVYRTLEA